ncbi:hypothetical protein CHS0354_009131 [Potamilus streckersoni]|uniref:Uncharacterized protein n=1 Tax=Potamilus streckersoni TaxID=2493646 RepID=A0AAE0SS36_9BIVA|nr:hypothetical protein CHS0354_009131 [Potamilus streckersoni]
MIGRIIMNIAALLILCRITMVLAERKTLCYSSKPPRTGESVAFGPDTFWGTPLRRPNIFDIFGSSAPQQAHEDVQGNDAVHTSDETQPKEFCTDRTYEDDAETQPKGLYTDSANPDDDTTPKEIDTAEIPERLGPDGESNPSTLQQGVFSNEDESHSTDPDENTSSNV